MTTLAPPVEQVWAWVDPGKDPTWDAELSRQTDTSVFHTASWARVLCQAYGFTPCYLRAVDASGTRLLWPCMTVRSWLTGTRGVSLPFTDECPPVSTRAGSTAEAFNQLCDLGKRQGWRYVEVRGGGAPGPAAVPSVRFLRHRLDLNVSSSQLWDRLDGTCRRAIRKARSAGVTVAFSSSPEALRRFRRLNEVTRRKHGLPPQPALFFDALLVQAIALGFGWVAEARVGDRTVAANVFLTWGRHAVYKYGASSAEGQSLRANNLAMWEAMERLRSEGYAELHLGRSSLANEGLCRFKRHFGARESELDYFKYDLRRGAYVREVDAAFGWYNRFFARLPLVASRWMGALAYRHTA